MLKTVSNRGFGLTQALIGLALTCVLGMGAYKVLKSVGHTTAGAGAKAQSQTEIETVYKILSHDLNNAIPFPNDSKSESESVLGNLEPNACKGTQTDAQEHPSGLIPLPGKTVATLEAQGTMEFVPITPSEASVTEGGSLATSFDAVRYVYRLDDSSPYPVERVSTGGVPKPTIGASEIFVSSEINLYPGDSTLR